MIYDALKKKLEYTKYQKLSINDHISMTQQPLLSSTTTKENQKKRQYEKKTVNILCPLAQEGFFFGPEIKLYDGHIYENGIEAIGHNHHHYDHHRYIVLNN